MKTKWIVLLILVLLAFPAGSHAWASRDPLGGGTWINRDPVSELEGGLQFNLSEPAEFSVGPNLYQYVTNDPLRYIDPLGLQEDLAAAVAEALASNSPEEIESVLDTLGPVLKPEAKQALQAAANRLRSKAGDIIAKECKGRINEAFPGEMRDKTMEEINDLAKAGNKAAQTAKKLLNDRRFKK